MKLLALIFFAFGLHGYEVSICAIFRNEAPYMKEWIEFHKIQGVEHFYLYNNQSDDNYLEVLKPYIDSQWVTLVEWSYTYKRGYFNNWLAIQTNAYKDCLKKYKNESTWFAMIDLDEFLFCPDGTNLREFLRPYLPFGGLCVNWLMFGTSGVETIAPGQTMIENLTHCACSDEYRNLRGKSIVQSKYVKGCVDAHNFLYQRGVFAVDADRNRIPNAQELIRHSHNQIRINHYWTRTESCFREKKIPSRNHRRIFDTPAILSERGAKYNLCIDTAILRFVPLLRKNMGFDF